MLEKQFIGGYMSVRTINRKKELLKELITQKGFITGEYLSKKMGVSPRTIRQDIKKLSSELKENNIELQAISSKGYSIDQNDQDRAKKYLESILHTSTGIPALPMERIKFMVRVLLFEDEIVDIDTLAEKLCVSRSTIEKDIQDVKKWFSKQGLELLYKKEQGIYIEGSEPLIRYAMVNYFAGMDFYTALPRLSDLSEVFGAAYVNSIRQFFTQIHKTEKINLSDADFLNLAAYLIVSISRIKKQKEIKQIDPEFLLLEKKKEYTIAESISRLIKQNFSITFSKTELMYLTKHLMQVNIISPTIQDPSMLEKKDLLKFMDRVLEKINTRYYLDFSKDDELIISLSHYLISLINRRKYKTLAKNPGLGEIAAQYPDALEIAITISNMLQEEYEITANEHEIGYIALYICAGIERQKGRQERPQKKVVIICTTGSGGSQLLAVKIRHSFPNLKIIGVYPTYRLNEAIKQNPDFIISTNPIENAECPVVQISHLLNDEDLINIKKVLYDASRKGKMGLEHLFRPELYFPEIDLNKREIVIQYLCKKVETLGLGNEGFTKMVIERESIFSTAIGNLVAIPHALNNPFFDSWIAVGILKKPILWGNELVQLVLLLNIDNSREENFSTIYEILYDRINNKKTIEQLLRTTNFENFMKVIINEQ